MVLTGPITVHSRVELLNGSCFPYFSVKTYVMGTEKNPLGETALLSTQNKCQNQWVKKYSKFYAQSSCLSQTMLMHML